jgi:hypothetical protein
VTNSAYNFSPDRPKLEDLTSIPSSPVTPLSAAARRSVEEIDRMAGSIGFESRQGTPISGKGVQIASLSRAQMEGKEVGVERSQLSFRPTVEVRNRFIQFSVEGRLSYPDALEELLNQSEELKRLKGIS